MLEEAITIQFKSLLLNNFEDIREQMEEEDVSITYNYNPDIMDFEILISASPELGILIQDRLK